ncbi:conserved exported hypothetical protein [Paraburkholderia sacchari]|uniref:hypothetical protein n=1 Tax=Paraburkholderia sacchari TaxID=159450 RepID=UPI0039A6BFF6
MKSLKFAVVACSLFAAASAFAQNEASEPSVPQQVAQSAAQPVNQTAKPVKKDECVGPASFCTLYFGS